MKTFLNCTPNEFIAQAVKLRAPFAAWIEKTGMSEIFRRVPEGIGAMDGEEKSAALRRQNDLNLADAIAAALEKDPQGTLEVLSVCCFAEASPDRPMRDYLEAFFEMLKDETIRSFFLLYTRSAAGSSSKA
ncbi:MAG: hypothetical protein IKE30_07925 [Clostridia bacterium]|nr:hypothetical protein [Clostridia bacterium]